MRKVIKEVQHKEGAECQCPECGGDIRRSAFEEFCMKCGFVL